MSTAERVTPVLNRSGEHLLAELPVDRPAPDGGRQLMRLRDVVLPRKLRGQLERVKAEQEAAALLESRGLTPRRKLLLVGPPGVGKTLTAAALAGELGLSLWCVKSHAVVSSYLGETAKSLAKIFGRLNTRRAVYLFDEFDGLAGDRGQGQDMIEMRRVVNDLLQLIERDRSDSIVVCATNLGDAIDRAFFRRFDDVLHFPLPGRAEVATLLDRVLGADIAPILDLTQILDAGEGLSFADIERAAIDALKTSIMTGRPFDQRELLDNLVDRRHASPTTATKKVIRRPRKKAGINERESDVDNQTRGRETA